VEFIPGVSAAVAAPAYAGIPVTHRGISSAVTIVAGNEDPAKAISSPDWNALGQAAGTLVFLMGMRNLGTICARLQAGGRPTETPVALIQSGTWPEQRTLTGTLADIDTQARAAGFKNPAVIVVGEVVRLREKLAWLEQKPLFGRTVLVTRADRQAGVMSALIEELGGRAGEFPVIRIAPPTDPAALDAAVRGAAAYDWLIFTSVNGVNAFWERLPALELDIRDLKGPRLAAIGPRTAAALSERGLRVACLPEEYQAENLARALTGQVRAGDRVLLPRADIARPFLAQALRELGAQVHQVTAYRTLRAGENADPVRRALRAGEIDAVGFTSSSTARYAAELLGAELLRASGAALASIGPITSATARELGLPVTVEAGEYTVPGLVSALAAYFGSMTSVSGNG
jgi:uroporphyrinogen III methyltransferase/synthase